MEEHCDGTRTDANVMYCISQTEENREVHICLIQPYSIDVSHSVTTPGFFFLGGGGTFQKIFLSGSLQIHKLH